MSQKEPFTSPIWADEASSQHRGNKIFSASLPCDLFIVDELGPFELIRGEGWVNALEALRQPTYRIGIVVIRPELVKTARQILPITQVFAVEGDARMIKKTWMKISGQKEKK
jgi:hypothetical protein